MGREFKSPRNLIALCVGLAVIQSVAGAGCREGCPVPNTSSKYKYEPKKIYSYNFDTVATVQMAGADAQETSVKVSGVAQIFPTDDCAYTLKFRQLTVNGPDKKSKHNVVNEMAKPVRFYMANDDVAAEICADGNDSDFSLNIKRGIISMFQTGDRADSTETDVFGRCPTSYRSSSNGPVTVITKTRNLNQCSHREKFGSGLVTGIVDDHSEVKSTPLLNGDYTYEATIKNGILESVHVTEEYVFLPFSSNEAGIRSKVNTKMVLKEQTQANAGAPKVGNPHARSIIFSKPVSTPVSNINALKSVFQSTLKEFNNNNVGAHTASQFTELIHLMRNTNKNDLTALYQQVKSGTLSDNKPLARKVFFDAIFRAGTGDSVETLANLLKSRELNEKEQKLLYLSLNLVQSMTKESLNAVSKLLDQNPPKEAYLSVGHVVNKYCRDHDCEAADVKAINEKFVAKLGACKPTTRADEDMTVAVLKGIRNTQHLVNPVLEKVLLCTNDKATTRIRVSALQAFAANPCHKKMQTAALNILKNRNEDSEVRIEAYLAAVECPSTQLANEIKTLLESEPIYQVGSYITTHLAGVRSSTDSKREAARQYFKDVYPEKQFPFDPRRYSFNREFSYAIDALGFGSSIDSNVIYSQKSFLPRSARVNLTGELFGHSFNVMEFNGRQENLDLFVEHYFGPKGVISTQSSQEMINNFLNSYKDMQEHARNRLAGGRGRRGVKEDLTNFDKNVKFGSDFNQDLDLDFSLKFFGSELFFLSLGQNLPSTPKELLDYFLENLNGGMDQVKNFDYTFEHHALFMDADMYYPTALGIPLKLAAKGSGAARFEVAGQIDVRQLMNDPKNSNFRFKFVPSTNVFISGLVSIDALAVSTGLEVTGSVHSATGGDFKFQVVNGKKLSVELDTPFREQKLFGFNQTVQFVSQDRGQEVVRVPLVFSTRPSDLGGCFDQVQHLLGIEICAKFSLTKPTSLTVAPFPLSGHNDGSVTIKAVEKYAFVVEYKDDDPEEPSISFLFDTPNSSEDRKIELLFEGKLKESHTMAGFTLNINSIAFKVNGAAGFKNDNKEVKLYGHFNVGSEEHKLELGFTKKGNERRQEYTPIVNLNIDYKVDGSVVVEKANTQTKYTFNNVRVQPPKDTPFTMNGQVVRDAGKLDLDLTFAKDKNSGTVNGKMVFQPRELLFDMSVKSNFMEQANGLVKLSLKEEDTKTGRSIKNSFNFVYGKDLKSQVHRVDFIQNIDLRENKEKKVVATKYDNKFYVGDFPLTIIVNGDHDKKVNKFEMNFDYDGFKGNFDVQHMINQKAKGDYNLKIAAGCKDHTVTWTSTRSIEAGDKSKIANKLETTLGVRFELNGLVGHKFTAKDADVNLQGIFQAKPQSDLYKATIFIQNNEKESNSNFKFVIGKTDYANYEGKVVYGTASSGNFKVFVHQVLEGTADYTSNNGKGEANVLLELKDDGRKLKATTAFTIQKPTYDVSVDFFYDFERDNNKKAHFTTNNKVTKSTFDSKNRFEILSEKYTFNVAGSQTGTMKDGVTKGNVEIVLPTGRRLMANINRELRLKIEKPKGSVDFKISDELPNKQKRQVSFNGKMTHADFEAGYFDVQGTFKYNDFNSKEIVVETGIKNLKKGQQFSAGAVTLKVHGSMIAAPFNLNVNLDEYDTAHAIFKVVGAYSDKYSIDVKGKYFVGTAKRPHSHEMTATINMPDTKLQKIVFVSNGKVKEPRNDKDFVEVEYTGTLDYMDHRVSVKTSLKASRNEGSGSIFLELPKRDPINASGSYKYSHDKNTDTCHMEGVFDLSYQAGKKFHADGKCSYSENKQFTLDGNLQTDVENARNIQVSYLMRRENEFTYVENAKLVADGKVYRVDTRLVTSNTSPLVDVTLEYPDHPIVKFYFESQKLGDRKRKMIVNVENFGDFGLQLNAETDYSTLEAFYILGDVHSEKLKLNKVNFDVRAKSGASKGVEFKISSAGQNVLSGSADFTTKVDKGHNIIEGKGNVKYYDKANTITFKVIRNLFEAARDGEVGMGTIVNVSVGPQNIVVEFKATDKNFLAKYTTCQQTKQCVNIEARSQLERSDPEHFKHLLMISVDLRELGYTHEFGLKADTARNGYVIEHSVDMHLQSQNKPQYQFNFYIQPKKSGAILTLPTRVVAVETIYTYPEQSSFGKYQVSGAFYLDKKNSPDKKAELSMDFDLKRNRNVVVGKGEMRFVHSGLRPLVISGTTSMDPERQLVECSMEADVFQHPNNKIVMKGIYGNTDTSGTGYNVTVDVSVKSDGLKLNAGFTGHSGFSLDRRYMSVGSSVVLPMDDFKFGTFMYAGDEGYELLVQGFNEDLIQTNCQYNLAKLEFNYGSTLRFPGIVPLEASGKFRGPFMAEFHAKQGDLAVFDGHYELGNELSVKVTSKGQNVFVGRVGLDQAHFLTSEYKIDENQINDFVKRVQESSKADTQKAEDFLTDKYNKITKNFMDKLKAIQNAMPDFTNVQNMYQQELKQMVEEMKRDDTIKAIIDFVTNVFEKISRIFDVIVTEYMDAYKKMHDIVYTFYEQFVEAFNEKVLPDLKVLYKQVQELVFSTYEDTVKLLSATFSRVAKALKSVEEDFNKISKSISEIFAEVSKMINDFVHVFTQEMERLINTIKEYIQQIPGFDVIKEQYNELVTGYGLSETFANLVREITSTFSDLLPSAEVKEFVQKFTEYIEKKLQGAQVKDVEELKQLYVMLIKAVRSVMDMVRAQNKEWSESAIAVPFTFEAFKRLPFVTSVRFSPLNYVKNERLVSFKDILYLYRPYGFNPFEMIPPFTLHGEIVDGSHVFTFDGRHYTFPGTCSYVLARDFVNGNFSLVAQMERGKMKSITLVDKDSGTVQVNNEGLVTLNGKSSELPIHLSSMHAWRDYYSVSLLSTYGAEVTCTTDLRVCHFTVSGYYLGKTRGLLGNGNSEPYDDYLLPSNKISENTIEFGNAYRTQSNCQPVAVTDEHSEHEHSSEQCARMFSESSPLRYCYLFVNPANYREACEHAVHEADDSHKNDAACTAAFGYVSRCGNENVPVSMPSECHKCAVDGQQIEVGDEFSVKVPQKQSDIVVIVDTQLGNLMGELVQGIITDLRANLKQRDISDVHIAVIGYNKDHKYLYFFTSNGKLDFTGRLQNVKTDGPEEEKPLKTGNEALDEFFESVNNSTLKLKEDLGLSADAQAFQAAMQYPFRAAATKTILAVRSDNLQYSVNPAKVFAGILSSQTAKNKGIGLHVITPVEELALTKDSAKVNTIIGFDSRVVITYNEKKRANMGSVDMRNNLKFQSDMGTDLVEKNNGYVAILQNYVNARPEDRKKYVNLLSYTLAEQISRTEIQSDCTCKLASGVYPETECEAKETKLLPPRKAAGRG